MFPVKESFLNPRTAQTAPSAIKGFSAGSSLTDADDDRTYGDKLKDDVTEKATEIAKGIDLDPKTPKAIAAKAPEMNFSVNRALQSVEQAAKVKLAAEGVDVDSLPWTSGGHELMHCIKCGGIQRCRCTRRHPRTKGICFSCKQDDKSAALVIREPGPGPYNYFEQSELLRCAGLLPSRAKLAEVTETHMTGAPKLNVTPAQAAAKPVNTLTTPSPTPTPSPAPAPAATGAAAIPTASAQAAAAPAPAPAPQPAAPVAPVQHVPRGYGDMVTFLGRAPTDAERRTFYQLGAQGKLDNLGDPATRKLFQDTNRTTMQRDSAYIRDYEQASEESTGSLWNPATYWSMMAKDPTTHNDLRQELAEQGKGWEVFGELDKDADPTNLTWGQKAQLIGNGLVNIANPYAAGGKIMGSAMDIGDVKAQASEDLDKGNYLGAAGNYAKAFGSGANMAMAAMPFAAPLASALSTTGAGQTATAALQSVTPQVLRNGASAAVRAANAAATKVLPQHLSGAMTSAANPGTAGLRSVFGPGGAVAGVADATGDTLVAEGDRRDGIRNPNDGILHATGKDVLLNAAQIPLSAASGLLPTAGDVVAGVAQNATADAVGSRARLRNAVNAFNTDGAAIGITHNEQGQQLGVEQVATNLDKVTRQAKALNASPEIAAKLDKATAQAKEEVARGDTSGFGMQLLMMLMSMIFGGGGMFGGIQPTQVAAAPAYSPKANNTTPY